MGAVVLGLSEKWILFSFLIDGVIPNAYRVVRRRSIRRAKVSLLMNEYLRVLDVVPPPSPEPPINLIRTRDVVESVAARRQAFSIYREEISSGTYLLGSPIEWCPRSLWFLTVDTKARWDSKMTKIRLRDISQIGFEGAYEKAIVAVAGPMPERSTRR